MLCYLNLDALTSQRQSLYYIGLRWLCVSSAVLYYNYPETVLCYVTLDVLMTSVILYYRSVGLVFISHGVLFQPCCITRFICLFFFLRCEHVKRFWEQLQTVVNNACTNGLFVNLNESIVLFGHDCSFKSDDTFDLIILLVKFFIYKCKVKKNISQFHLLKKLPANSFRSM